MTPRSIAAAAALAAAACSHGFQRPACLHWSPAVDAAAGVEAPVARKPVPPRAASEDVPSRLWAWVSAAAAARVPGAPAQRPSASLRPIRGGAVLTVSGSF
jgi:hypothetical protein